MAYNNIMKGTDNKTIVISVMKEEGDVEYAVVPLQSSYSNTVATAFVVLKDYLDRVMPETVCLKISTKTAMGKVIWANVAPSLWNDTVSAGAELRIFSSVSGSPAWMKDHTWNSPTTVGRFNAVNHNSGGRGAVAFDGAFYAYIHDISNDAHWRMVIIFASRTVADEWWRAVSTSKTGNFNIKRVTPQFYTHDSRIWTVDKFFSDSKITDVAANFRGKVFFVLENDRGGRGMTIIPTQRIVDHASGDWFAIRSKANAGHYWYYDEALGYITVSDTQRSLFKISATDMHDGAIMIGADSITLVVQHHGFVVPQTPNGQSGPTVLGATAQAAAFMFKFEDLDKGRFVPGNDDPPPLCYMPQGGITTGWELAL